MIDITLALAQAAAACYDASSTPWFENEVKTIHVYRSLIDDVNVFAFEGTTDFWEWMVDFAALPIEGGAVHQVLGPVHGGFLAGVQQALPVIEAALESLGWPPFYVCGHSKGAGEAILCHALLKAAGHVPLGTRSYEPPCVGGPVLAAYVAGDDLTWTKTWNATGADVVTQVPEGPDWCHDGVLLPLRVPDAYGIAEKHRIPAVLEALGAATA